ncbi:acetyltransferase (GNAT) family protein [Knoellia remsis]|uniref:Acetyltransferase (GNAT) family protein n=2 Tax=Knoellia remsis TaxID=407159 RepID=A0A2T0V0G6_9MICO|nr:acetyltransferase (GNAT) family protein [Knoellia remsis]
MAQTDDAAVEFFDAARKHWDERGFGFWVALDRESGELVGVGGVKDIDGAFLNLYYRLAFDRLGQGLGTEIARAAAAHALEFLPELPVRALVKEVNVPSVRTALRAGFQAVGAKVLRDDLPDEAPSIVFEAPRVEAATAFDAATREQVLDLWVRTNDAGGAVGFTPGAPRGDVDAALARHEEAMAEGASTAVLLRSAVDGRVIGMALVTPAPTPLMPHVATVWRVMTDPDARGRNLGRLLMAGVHRVSRKLGLEILTLNVRSGTGTTRFYEACGYEVTGRVLGAIRVAPGDDRDDIWMARRLDGRVLTPDVRD